MWSEGQQKLEGNSEGQDACPAAAQVDCRVKRSLAGIAEVGVRRKHSSRALRPRGYVDIASRCLHPGLS